MSDGVEGARRVFGLRSVGTGGRGVQAVSGAWSETMNARLAVSADIAGSILLAAEGLRGRCAGGVSPGGPGGVAVRSRIVVWAVVVCVTVALWLAGTGAAVASGWAIQAVPVVPGPTGTSGQLSAVSCTSRTSCTAVGSYTNSAAVTLALAERWNGARWSIQQTPDPAGATGTSLSGVSCTSTNACTAVGSYSVGSVVRVTLAERWNGVRWSIQRIPSPPGATLPSLGGVSCTSRTACIAVGSYLNTPDPYTAVALVERWNGARWLMQRIPNPPGVLSMALGGVSCTSRTACIAVGSLDKRVKPVLALTLAARWNGTRWTIQRTPNPARETNPSLSSVSCSSATACTAVGSSAAVTLAEVWDGTRWRIQGTPNPAGRKGIALSGVSCASRSDCIAVGSYTNRAGTVVALAESRNGARWRIQGTPNPAGAKITALSGVWCTSRTACIAVGNFTSSAGVQLTVAERRNGSGWAIQQTRNPVFSAGSSTLNGVSCTSATACTAVGSYTNHAGTQVVLAEAWDGTSWTIQTTPDPSGASSTVLNGVSCASATACVAVGSYTSSAGTVLGLAETWNGTSWTIQNPGGGGLSSVSCTSARACVAVGGSLSAIWNGSSWTIHNMPPPSPGPFGGLNGVSCTSPTACTAVGSNPPVTLAEAWDGASWTPQNTLNDPSAVAQNGGTWLDGVACTSATACIAVGGWSAYHEGGLVAELWDGATWALQSVGPGGAFITGELNGVSCPSANACTAVGIRTDGEAAAAWDGTSWTIQSTPTPSGATLASQFNAVSCTSATACTAVGSTVNLGAQSTQLIEQES
jgi:hypothetical protein